MRHRLALSAVLLYSLLGFAQQLLVKPAEPAKPAPERPSQAAVLAKDSVVKRDVAYGQHEKQKLDIYAPKDAKGAGVVIFIHGGEWTKGDKENVSFKPKMLNEAGFVFVSTNYRLSPEVKHPAHVSDVAAAIRWVRDNIRTHGGDPEKIVLMGHSAGCHLATLVSLDPKYLTDVKMKPTDLRGVVAWSGGMYDLADRVKGEGMYPKYIKETFGEDEAAQKAASPMEQIGKAPAPPFLFISIEKGNASHKASEAMIAKIGAAKGKAEGQLLEGRTHFEANHLVGAPDDKTGDVLLQFLSRVAK